MPERRAEDVATRDSHIDAREGRMTTEDDRFASALRVNQAMSDVLDPKPVVRHVGVHALYAPLLEACQRQGDDGYALVRVVPRFGPEAVAVFQLVDADDDDGGTTSISDVLHELTDLLERAGDIDGQLTADLRDTIQEVRACWPYAALVRRRLDSTGEPVDA